MSESPSPPVAENAAVHPSQALTLEAIDAVLNDFRAWLTALAAQPIPEVPAAAEPAIDLHTLLGQFTALRHEVNLQTKATRAQQEQNAETLRQFSAALTLLEEERSAAGRAEQQAREEIERPLLKTLVDAYDALSLAEREVRRGRENVLPALDETNRAAHTPPRPSFWARWFGARTPDAVKQEEERGRQAREAAGRVRQLLDSLLTGYTMSLQRLERALRQHGLEPMPASGRPFDPETMEVVEAVFDSGRPAGEVIEEVRRGYLWNGRVFRYAQVRVAKS